MNSYKLTIAGGCLVFAFLCVRLVALGAEAIYEPAHPNPPAYRLAAEPPPQETTGVAPQDAMPPAVAAPAPAAPAPSAPSAPDGEPGLPASAAPPPAADGAVAVRVAAVDPAAMAGVVRRCVGCHSFEKGQAARIGPNLWGIVQAPLGHQDGYGYSAGMLARKAEGLSWTFDNLDAFLQSPGRFVPGTKMTFPGFPSPEERAAVIAYLRTLAEAPVPLPGGSAPPR